MILGLSPNTAFNHKINKIPNKNKASNSVTFKGLKKDKFEKDLNEPSKIVDERIKAISILLDDLIEEVEKNEEKCLKEAKEKLDKTLKDNSCDTKYLAVLKNKYLQAKTKEEKIDIMKETQEYSVKSIFKPFGKYEKNIVGTFSKVLSETEKVQDEREKIQDLCKSAALSSAEEKFLDILTSDEKILYKYSEFLFKISAKRDACYEKSDKKHEAFIRSCKKAVTDYSIEMHNNIISAKETFTDMFNRFKKDFTESDISVFLDIDGLDSPLFLN